MTYSKLHSVQIPFVFGREVGDDAWPPKYPTILDLELMRKWCRDNVGDNNWNYYGMYRKVPCEFKFKRSEDCLAFKLKFLC